MTGPSILIVILDKLRPCITFLLLQLAQGFSLNRFQNVKRTAQRLVHVQDTCIIIKLAAVVGCRENGHQSSVSHELIAIFDDLVSPANESELVPAVKLSDYVLSEHKAHASIIVGPPLNVKLRVGPEQVAQKSSVRYILGSSLLIDALQIVEVWAEAAMHTQNTIVNDSCNR